jgi:hypothetical protein
MQNTRISISFYSLLLIALTFFALPNHSIQTAAAANNTPTYVLGVTDPNDPLIVKLQTLTTSVTILPSISSLNLAGANSILFVDGNWLRTVTALDPTVLSLIVGKVVSGLPTIEVRGNPTLLGDSISGLTRYKATGVSAIADGVQIASTLTDGTRVGSTLEVISGFDYAVGQEFSFAQQTLATVAPPPLLSPMSLKLSPYSPTTRTATTTAPFWQFILSAAVDTGDAFAPYGRVINTLSEYTLQNSGTNSYRWRNFFLNTTVTPGISIYAGSTWRTLSELEVAHPNSAANVIVDDGPRDQGDDTTTSISYSIGVRSGERGAVVTSSQSMTYPLRSTSYQDLSTEPDVSWIHNINTRTSEGTIQLKIIPGWTLRVTGTSPPLDLTSSSQTTFATMQGDTRTTTVNFSAFGG